jgi:hypothetical protein
MTQFQAKFLQALCESNQEITRNPSKPGALPLSKSKQQFIAKLFHDGWLTYNYSTGAYFPSFDAFKHFDLVADHPRLP